MSCQCKPEGKTSGRLTPFEQAKTLTDTIKELAALVNRTVETAKHSDRQPATPVEERVSHQNLPNLARHQKDEVTAAEIDRFVQAELNAAGITPHKLPYGPNGEVPTRYIGLLHSWDFQRAWRYYIAKGPGIPPDVAQRFHQVWGHEVRVDGHCGCPSPLEWFKGFAVGQYHIDTQEGLNAFAGLLRSIYRDPQEAPKVAEMSPREDKSSGNADIVINGKVDPLWQPFVHKQDEWIGGTLEDLSEEGETPRTKIVAITLKPNRKESAILTIEGEDFSCGCDVQYLGVPMQEDRLGGQLTLSGSFGWRCRITKPAKEADHA